MKTSVKERAEVIERLARLGFDYSTANQLRRIAMTLRNWFELECGTGDNRVTRSIERDDNGEGKPLLRVQYQTINSGWHDKRYPIADREAGARKRLAAIMAPMKRRLVAYVQPDCRGASLHIVRKSDLRGQSLDSVYTRGVAVY